MIQTVRESLQRLTMSGKLTSMMATQLMNGHNQRITEIMRTSSLPWTPRPGFEAILSSVLPSKGTLSRHTVEIRLW